MVDPNDGTVTPIEPRDMDAFSDLFRARYGRDIRPGDRVPDTDAVLVAPTAAARLIAGDRARRDKRRRAQRRRRRWNGRG